MGGVWDLWYKNQVCRVPLLEDAARLEELLDSFGNFRTYNRPSGSEELRGVTIRPPGFVPWQREERVSDILYRETLLKICSLILKALEVKKEVKVTLNKQRGRRRAAQNIRK